MNHQLNFFMFKFINDYFYFNQKERRGIFMLLSIILTLICINLFVIPHLGKEEPIDKEAMIAWVDSLMQKPSEQVETKIIEYFKFDPNLIAKKDWLKLGLSEKQTQIILNYRKAGGKFFKNEDLRKIYSISKVQYKKLEPFIFIRKTKTKTPNKISPPKKTFIELNSADSMDLVSIYGIGPVLSSRIIKYRKLLGGYVHPSQLTEVYGIDSAKFQKIKHNFTSCDTAKLILLNINTADFKELLKHPYISYEFVKYIVNARKAEGFNSVEDLSVQTIIPDSVFRKLRPYLRTK